MRGPKTRQTEASIWVARELTFLQAMSNEPAMRGAAFQNAAPSHSYPAGSPTLLRTESRISALINAMPINASTKENGNAPMIIAVCSAPSPPAIRRKPMTAVSVPPQKMM